MASAGKLLSGFSCRNGTNRRWLNSLPSNVVKPSMKSKQWRRIYQAEIHIPESAGEGVHYEPTMFSLILSPCGLNNQSLVPYRLQDHRIVLLLCKPVSAEISKTRFYSRLIIKQQPCQNHQHILDSDRNQRCRSR